jgi:hypothetical protein
MGCDMKVALGLSAQFILDLRLALCSQSMTEIQSHIYRRSIEVVSRRISQIYACLIRARQPLCCRTLVQSGL